MSKKKGAGSSKANPPTEKKQQPRQMELFNLTPEDTTTQEKKQTRFDRIIAARCAVLSFDDAEEYIELEQRYRPGGGGLSSNKEVNRYYELRGLATVRLLILRQRSKSNG